MSGTRFMTPSRSSAESFELEAHVTEQEAWLPLLHFPRVRKKKEKGTSSITYTRRMPRAVSGSDTLFCWPTIGGMRGGSQTLNQAKDDMFMAGTKDYLAEQPRHKTQ